MEHNIPVDEKALGVIITNTKSDGALTYDAVRRTWKFTPEQLEKANAARYILAIENSTVVDIFEKHGDFRESNDEPGRYIFSPVPVCDINVRRAYIGKNYRSYGLAVVFFGYDEAK